MVEYKVLYIHSKQNRQCYGIFCPVCRKIMNGGRRRKFAASLIATYVLYSAYVGYSSPRLHNMAHSITYVLLASRECSKVEGNEQNSTPIRFAQKEHKRQLSDVKHVETSL